VSLFRLDATIRTEGSVSQAIADVVEQSWMSSGANTEVTRRHVGLNPLPSSAWALAVKASRIDPSELTPAHHDAVALAATLASELLDADALVFATPLYNFGVSQHFKTWVDLVLTDPRMAAGAKHPLAPRPAVLVMVRGGAYGPGTPREGWDHASGWTRRILEDVWGLDLRVIETEFTLAAQNPALAQFVGVAEGMRREADRLAADSGEHLVHRAP
jgi:FMN-dependent NADH-azoreductase